MKKLLIIFLLIMILVPIKVDAVESISIPSSSIIGNNEASVGDEINLTFKINFSGVGTEDEHNFMIWGIGYEVLYDSTVLQATNFIPGAWLTPKFEKTDPGYFLVENYYDANSKLLNQCRDGIYCTETSSSFEFFIKDTTQSETTVKLGQIAIVYIDLNNIENIEEGFKEDDFLIYTANLNQEKKISIPQSDKVNIEIPTSSIEFSNSGGTGLSGIKDKVEKQETPKITVPNGNSNSNQQTAPSTVKSDNNYLKSITIEGYPIEFKRDQMKYEIKVENNIDKLGVIVEKEDEKATVEIKGADPLKEEIQIKVTAENGNEQVYTIFVDSKEEKITESKKKKDIKKEVEKFVSNPRTLIIGGIVIAIIIIYLFISTHNGRKIDKMLDKI